MKIRPTTYPQCAFRLLASIILWTLSTLPAMCQPSMSVIGPDFPGITVGSPSSTNVAAAMSRASSVLSSDIRPLMPYGVLVTNVSPIPITAVDVLFTCEVDGKSIVNNFFYHASELISPIEPLLLPSKSLLITPNHRVNMGLIFAEMPSSTSDAAPTVDLIHNTVNFLARCAQVTVSADLIVFAGGEVYGPDTAGTLRKFQSRMDGYREFRISLLQRLQGSESDPEIIAWLNKEAAVRVVKKLGEPYDRAVVERKTMAQQCLQLIRNKQRPQAITELQASPAEKVFSEYIRLKRMM